MAFADPGAWADLAYPSRRRTTWTDPDPTAYRAAVWERTHGLLIAMQGAIDDHFGDEVCLVAEASRLGDRVPGRALADWLSERSRRVHDIHGFPPLPR
jgi:hypothetical protein